MKKSKSRGKRQIQLTFGDRAFLFVDRIILLFAGAITLFPFLYVLAISLLSAEEYERRGIAIPLQPTLENYRMMITSSTKIQNAYAVTIYMTVVGTFIALMITAMLAYGLSKNDLPGHKFVNTMLVITMFFGGGMIPTYLLFSNVGLLDTYWVLILPGAVGTFNIILMRNFMEGIPPSLEESAHIDGASNFTVLFKIILPMSVPAIATISLFFAVGKWNAYFNAVLYTTKKTLMPIQLYLRNILQNLDLLAEEDPEQLAYVSTEGVRASTTISAILPILCVYPFLQKYFVGGMVIGAVKE